MTTNDFNAFITVSGDCPVDRGTPPHKAGGIAQLQYVLLAEQPYTLTSDDLLFEVHVRRHGIAEADRDWAREAFFGRSQACLRASPLVKQFGWGVHYDEQGRVALYGVETDDYRRLSASSDLKVVPGMRSRRAGA